jgi:membrane protein required for beta-lactamase induction
MEPKNLREWLMVYKATTVGDTEKATRGDLQALGEFFLEEIQDVKRIAKNGEYSGQKALSEIRNPKPRH